MVGLMKSLSFSFIILASFATLFTVADARSFKVGDTGAWVVKPQESYNTWAERNRFQVNDTLDFKYAKGSDSVLRVVKADYESCNIKNPKEKYAKGSDSVTLNQSGPFYFISGNQEHCIKGQKLVVVVLADRNQPKVPISPAKAPSTAQPPKAHTPVSPVAPAKSPSTAQPPKSLSPVSPVGPAKAPSSAKSPKSHSPVSPPAKAPSTAESPKSHSPVSPAAPAKAPSASQPPKSYSPVSPIAPAKAPSTAKPPKANSPVSPVAPAKAPSASSPAKPPTSSPSPDQTPASPAPENTPSLSPTPAADNIKAPAPSPKSAASGVAVISVLTTVLSLAFTVLMFA